MINRLALIAAVGTLWLTPLAARAEVRAEFHQVYPIAADGRVAVENVNGVIRISSWDRNEVKVDAVKHGRSQEDLDDARIVVDASAGSVEVRTKYPEHNHHDHSAGVDYTITVPRGVSLSHISSVNGDVTVDGVSGPIHANTVNGKVSVARAHGDLNASTVNGGVEAAFDQLSARTISLNTVNGGIRLALPQDAGATLDVSTLNGDISTDFNLSVRHAEFGPGSSIKTTLGAGGASVKLASVNGGINLARH